MVLNVLYPPDLFTLAALLAGLADEDAAQKQIANVQKSLTPWQSTYVAFTAGSLPAFLWAQNPDQLVIVITGATIPQQGIFLGLAALGPALPVGGANVNVYCIGPARSIIASLSQKGAILPPSVVIVGHSYGGALAEVVAAILVQGFPGTKVQLLTMGAPRAGDTSLSGTLEFVTHVRLMNHGDPIPFFPFHWVEAPIAVTALGYFAAQALEAWVQPGGGVLLDASGAMTPAVLPPSLFPVTDLTLAGWAAGQNSFASTEHWYRTYLLRLSLFQPLAPAPPVGPRAGLKGELFEPIPAVDFALGPVLGPAALIRSIAMAVSSVYIPPSFRFSWLKVGTYYVVVWMNVQICRAPAKSQAKTLAKYGNKLLKELQIQTSVDHTQFGNALQSYLTAASSSTNKFMPVLTVT